MIFDILCVWVCGILKVQIRADGLVLYWRNSMVPSDYFEIRSCEINHMKQVISSNKKIR